MNDVDGCVARLAASLRVRGRARRRLLAECRDHLADASAEHGPGEAVRRFGDPDALARDLDAEVAVRRSLVATLATAAAVVAVACSTLVLVHGADGTATASVGWAVVFFAAAQTSAGCVVLALVRAAATWRAPVSPADVALLCRRNASALGFAMLTMVAAGGAIPGEASPGALAAGPVAALGAGLLVLRARRLVRPARPGPLRHPVGDVLLVVLRSGARPTTGWASIPLLPPTVLLAAVAAFAWDHLDRGTWTSSVVSTAVESALVVAGFVLLGPALGLRGGRRRHPAD